MLWEVEELKKVSELQPELVDIALSKLWKENPQLHKAVVMNAYLDAKISLGKAADILGLARIELEREMMDKGIPIRRLSTEDINAEVTAVKP